MVQKVFLFLNKVNRIHPKRLAAKHQHQLFFFFFLIKHRVDT